MLHDEGTESCCGRGAHYDGQLIGNNSIITQKPHIKPQNPTISQRCLEPNWNCRRTSVCGNFFFAARWPQSGFYLKTTRPGVSWPTSANRIALFRRVFGTVWYGMAWSIWYMVICTRPETTLARYRRVFITFIFIQFSNLPRTPVLRHAYHLEGGGESWVRNHDCWTLWARQPVAGPKTTGICVGESRLGKPKHTHVQKYSFVCSFVMNFLCYREQF